MSSSCFWAVRETLPHVKVVFDRFHVVSLMNQAIDEVEVGLSKRLDSLGQQTLKGSRFLLLRNYDSSCSRLQSQADVCSVSNVPFLILDSMKEQLRLFWEKADRKEAEQFMLYGLDAMNSGIKALKRVGKPLLPTAQAFSTTFSSLIISVMRERPSIRYSHLFSSPDQRFLHTFIPQREIIIIVEEFLTSPFYHPNIRISKKLQSTRQVMQSHSVGCAAFTYLG